jgi:hypothetical protein
LVSGSKLKRQSIIGSSGDGLYQKYKIAIVFRIGLKAIVLCAWEQLSLAEAAAIMETTPKAVESRLYRARGILRERLKSWL